MRVLLLLLVACHLCGWSQAQTATISSMNAIPEKWDSTYGTQGIRLELTYLYTDPQRRISVQVPTIRLLKEGRLVYKSTDQVLPLRTNSAQPLDLFIPYRAINLLEGSYQNLTVELELAGTTAQTKVSFQQPQRYQVEIDLYKAEIKKQLENYDQGDNPQEWLPDGYFILTTHQGTVPLYQSSITPNQYELPAQKIKVHLLAQETLIWSFYDRDGAKGQLLGQYTLPEASGDLVEDYYGQMFGQIKNLDFKYAQRVQAPQAISVYSNRYINQEKKGVVLTLQYDLAQAYRGKKATAHFEFYDKNGIRLSVPLVQAMGERTPEPDQLLTLTTKGKAQYFIPFYVWKEDCRTIEFYFTIEETGEKVRATRHALLEPFQFENWVVESRLDVKENVEFQGIKGVELKVSYELSELYKDAPLHIHFYQMDGTALPFELYYLPGGNLAIPFQKQHITKGPKQADQLKFFIPYESLNGEVIGVRAELIPDVAMHIFEDFTPALHPPKNKREIGLRLVKADERFKMGNYGQVLDLDVKVPAFYQEHAVLYLEVLEEGKPSVNYKINATELQKNCYPMREDSARVYIVLPHRRLLPNTTFDVSIQLIHRTTRKPMSELIKWSWNSPRKLFNTEIQVALNLCKFDKKVLQASNIEDNFPWEYVIEAGGDVLARQALMPNWNNRTKAAYLQKVQVNREDDIIVKLQHRKTGKQLVIWKGDLSKWEQSNFKAELSNRYPIRSVKISAEVPKNYDSNDLNPNPIGRF